MSTVCPDDVAVTKANAPAFQFRLAHLFGLTTLCAIAAALVAAWGIGTLPMSVGLIAAWLNWCGAFRVVQASWHQQLTLWAAWGAFLLSLALPALVVFGDSPIEGWAAAWFVLTVPWAAFVEKEAPVSSLDFWLGLSWYMFINVANLLAVLMPLLIWRLRRGRGQWLAAALCLAMVAPWSVGWDAGMRVGYHVWCGSFTLALSALPMTRWTFVGMLTVAALSIAVVTWIE